MKKGFLKKTIAAVASMAIICSSMVSFAEAGEDRGKRVVMEGAVTNKENGHHYVLFKGALSYLEANEYCKKMGGHLVTITSEQEQSLVEKLLLKGKQDYYWIGLNDEKENGKYEWVTGEGFSYSNWDWNQPDNCMGSDEKYVYILNMTNHWDLKRFKWGDTNVDWSNVPGGYSIEKSGFICEMDVKVENISYNHSNKSTYVLFKGPLSYTAAEEYCERIGGHLVTITSEKEQSFIEKLLLKGKQDYYWIGLNDEKENGKYEWVTGEAFSYRNWDWNQPDNCMGSDEKYAYILNMTNHWDLKRFKWGDTNSNWFNVPGGYSILKSGFICEIERKATHHKAVDGDK
ncbi:MAG: C-type lectin domain-containing protein [Clostridia bacterium]|nr:C-type lectin domain-containing protein [Clostridia bacterium]